MTAFVERTLEIGHRTPLRSGPLLSGRILSVMDELLRIDGLNQRFGISGVAEVIAGNGGLPKVRVTTPLCTAEIYLHGAQVTAWQPAGAEEAIFLSEQSHWKDG